MKSYNIAEIKNIPLTNFIELRDGLNENCPFCEHKDHFYFNKAKNTYRSFNSCCRGGSIIDFIMESRGLNFTDSVNWLGDYYNVDSEKLEIQNKATVNRLKRINLFENKRMKEEINTFFTFLKYADNKINNRIFQKAITFEDDTSLMHFIYNLKSRGLYPNI